MKKVKSSLVGAKIITNNGNIAIIKEELDNSSYLLYCFKYEQYFILDELAVKTASSITLESLSKEAYNFCLEKNKTETEIFNQVEDTIINSVKLLGEKLPRDGFCNTTRWHLRTPLGRYRLAQDYHPEREITEIKYLPLATLYKEKNKRGEGKFPFAIDRDGAIAIANDLIIKLLELKDSNNKEIQKNLEFLNKIKNV